MINDKLNICNIKLETFFGSCFVSCGLFYRQQLPFVGSHLLVSYLIQLFRAAEFAQRFSHSELFSNDWKPELVKRNYTATFPEESDFAAAVL